MLLSKNIKPQAAFVWLIFSEKRVHYEQMGSKTVNSLFITIIKWPLFSV